METEKIIRYAYSIPFFIMAIAFLGMINLHWFAGVISFVCVIFGVINYSEEGKK